MNAENLFLSQLPLIERVARNVCHRHSIYGVEAEDFEAAVKIKLIDDDYAVLRRFQGRCRLETYLTTVIVNQCRDYQDQKWGKWRHSALAKTLGADAKRLEMLTAREGWSLDEAIEHMQQNDGVELSRQELIDLDRRLPIRSPKRRLEGEDKLPEVPTLSTAEEAVLQKERDVSRQELERALQEEIEALESEDRLILQLCYWDGHKVAKIANLLDLPQRPLYSRRERLLRRLRERLAKRGFDRDEAKRLFEEPPS